MSSRVFMLLLDWNGSFEPGNFFLQKLCFVAFRDEKFQKEKKTQGLAKMERE